jgi:geranylgeranyl pyrophosphate synthase
MRQAVHPESVRGTSEDSLARWVDLPGLCCQAAGGHPEWADDLAVAWLLFYAAADLMDKVQDQDDPEPWWQDLGPGAALSVATGLYFSASLALHQIDYHPDTRAAAQEIVAEMYNSFLVMSSGQYRELITPQPSLEQFWENIAAKSGRFFATACRAAARIVTQERQRLDDFERYGHHLGMLIQIRDDLDDIQPPSDRAAYGQRREIARSLPVVYAQSVLPPADGEHLRECLGLASQDELAAGEVIRLLDKSNAALYLVTEMERHRQIALEAILRAAEPSPARDALENYLKIF